MLADDYSNADGAAILNFAQAQERAKATAPRATAAARPYIVANALEDYFRFLEHDGRSKHSVYDARHRADAFILPKLGDVGLSALTTERLRRWRDGLASMPPRLRTRKGEEQRHREPTDGDDAKRARRASANRTWTVLRAALNHAFHEGKCVSDLPWRKVKPFRRVDAARLRYLSIAEAKRLLNACNPDFRRLVQAALQTGARYGELIRLEIGDFNPDAGTIAVRQSKSGKPRYIVLSDEGAAFFREAVTGRASDEPLFLRADGKPWAASHQLRQMREASERARIDPPISFHGLRHTWASLAVMAGMPLMVVARNLGYSDTRMVEKHYGHMAPSFITDAVRKNAPRFGFKPGNVASIGRVR